MNEIKTIAKKRLYIDPFSDQYKSRTALIEMVLLASGYTEIANLGACGIIIYSIPEKVKLIHIRRW